MKYLILLVFLVGCDVPNINQCDDLKQTTLSWTTPKKREDGTDLLPSEIQEYEINYWLKETPETFDVITSIDNVHNITLDEGHYCFKISTTDINGLQGKFSSVVCKNIDCEHLNNTEKVVGEIVEVFK